MAWQLVGTVASQSEPDISYAIKRAGTGRLGCACLAYRFAPAEHKTCKHLEAYLVGEQLDAARERRLLGRNGAQVQTQPLAREGSVTVRVAQEVFTVQRRAISFGRVPLTQ